MVTPEGRIKVLDFGLAKRLAAAAAEDAETRTQNASLAHEGAIVGTLSYMSPEALRGGPADARGDIWSLGVMLYEMASGRLPFQGKSPFDLAAAILREAIPELPPGVSLALRTIIHHCLARARGRAAGGTGSDRVVGAASPTDSGGAAGKPAAVAVGHRRRGSPRGSSSNRDMAMAQASHVRADPVESLGGERVPPASAAVPQHKGRRVARPADARESVGTGRQVRPCPGMVRLHRLVACKLGVLQRYDMAV